MYIQGANDEKEDQNATVTTGTGTTTDTNTNGTGGTGAIALDVHDSDFWEKALPKDKTQTGRLMVFFKQAVCCPIQEGVDRTTAAFKRSEKSAFNTQIQGLFAVAMPVEAARMSGEMSHDDMDDVLELLQYILDSSVSVAVAAAGGSSSSSASAIVNVKTEDIPTVTAITTPTDANSNTTEVASVFVPNSPPIPLPLPLPKPTINLIAHLLSRIPETD